MNFKANDLRNFQRFAQQLSNILKMRQDGFCTFITFPAVRSAAIE
ncbi:hypothetical protein RA210_U630003 [Rubrivivax sp. A210]|nr:hypothetical protein RA210_U630003 [Rubrivivax sp. A210]